MSFDPQPELQGGGFALRPLKAGDFDGLYAAASDPEIWVGHPSKTRHDVDVFRGYFDFLLVRGGTLVVLDRGQNKIIGCSRYYTAPDMPGSISIGFTFLERAYWGGAANFEVKRLMLGHAFSTFDEVWFHIDPTNIRSQKATAKLGAELVCDATLDLAGAPVEWKCYRLTREAWRRRVQENEALSGRPGSASAAF